MDNQPANKITEPLKKYIINNSQIDSILNDRIIKEKNIQKEKTVLLLKIIKKNNGLQLKISFVDKDHFINNYYPFFSKGIKINGYTEKNDILIFILGDFIHNLLLDSDYSKDFNFVKSVKRQKNSNKIKVPPPPASIDIFVYTYYYKNGRMKIDKNSPTNIF